MHEIGNTLTPLMVNTELIVEQSRSKPIREFAKEIFKAARRIAFTLRRLRKIEGVQPVAYLGEERMLDLTDGSAAVGRTKPPRRRCPRIIRHRGVPASELSPAISGAASMQIRIYSLALAALALLPRVIIAASQPGCGCVPRLRKEPAKNLIAAAEAFPTDKYACKMTRAAIMTMTTGDWADRYGQYANYLRLNGMPPPTSRLPAAQ